MKLSLEQTNIDLALPEVASLLKDVQCNILKSHGRDCTVHLFLRFTAEPKAAKAAIAAFSKGYLTSAYQQYEQSVAWNRDEIPGGLVGCFFLSASGYAALEFDVDNFGDTDGNATFRGGMKHHGLDILGRILDTVNKDPDPDACGRFKDGTPLTLQDHDGAGDVNDFDYASDDRGGDKCPFHAHVRKVNPRGTTPFTSLEDERKRRIIRRGIPYGFRKLGSAPPRVGVGLLFMCYQADIHHQFEFIQRTWADNPNFPRNLVLPDTGDDPLIGQDSDRNAAQKWPTKWNDSERKRHNFGGYVTLKGGEYFFAPSVGFLHGL